MPPLALDRLLAGIQVGLAHGTGYHQGLCSCLPRGFQHLPAQVDHDRGIGSGEAPSATFSFVRPLHRLRPQSLQQVVQAHRLFRIIELGHRPGAGYQAAVITGQFEALERIYHLLFDLFQPDILYHGLQQVGDSDLLGPLQGYSQLLQ